MHVITSLLVPMLMLLPQSPEQAGEAPPPRPRHDTPWFDQWSEQFDRRQLPVPTTQQIAEVEEFAGTVSPDRWNAIQELPEPQHGRMVALMAQRFRQLQRLKERDPEMYQLRLDRLKLEDDLFRMHRNMDQYSGRDRVVRHMELENTAQRLVKKTFDERRLRIRRLEELVAREKDRLNEDEARINDIANDLFIHPASRDPRFLLEESIDEGGPGPGGPMGPGGPRGPRQGFGGPRREGPGRMGPPPQRPAEPRDGEPAPPPPPDAEPRQE